jgi:hypothetical protein
VWVCRMDRAALATYAALPLHDARKPPATGHTDDVLGGASL